MCDCGKISSKDYLSDSWLVGMLRACMQFAELKPSLSTVCCCICDAYAKYQITSDISVFDRMCLTLRYSEFCISTHSHNMLDDDTCYAMADDFKYALLAIIGLSESDIREALCKLGLK